MKTKKRFRPVLYTIDSVEHTKRMMLGLPIIQKSRTVPFGYNPHEDCSDVLVPDELAFSALYQAKKYLEAGHSYAEVSNWLTASLNLPLSGMGLHKVMVARHPVKQIVEMSLEEREQLATSAAHDYKQRINEAIRTGKVDTRAEDEETD